MYNPLDTPLCICHRCDNTRCFNPAHLFAGTPSQNEKDTLAKGRNPKAKFTKDIVTSMRKRYAQGSVTMTTIAKEYDTDTGRISRIINHKNWKV